MSHCDRSWRARHMFIEDDVMCVLKMAKNGGNLRCLEARFIGQFVDSRRTAFSQVELEDVVANVASDFVHFAQLISFDNFLETELGSCSAFIAVAYWTIYFFRLTATVHQYLTCKVVKPTDQQRVNNSLR